MRKFLFLITSLLLLAGCAQIVSLQGGPVDKIPPRIVENGITPPNSSTNFKAKEIRFKFEEFIKLNNPIQTISVIPDNIKIEATVEGKTLLLKLDGKLQENTTYVITMNGTVKDITESNDSLMQYVFSTGNFLDSLTYTGIIIDAYELSPVKNCFVGLYEPKDSAVYKKPLYYATTNEKGEFTFEYLKPGTFELYAFEDENKDSKWQVTEKIAFTEEKITVDTAQKDTLQLKLFKQLLPSKLSARYTFPSKFTVASKNPIKLQSLQLGGKDISPEAVYWYSEDSLSFVSYPSEGNQYQLIVNHIEDSIKSDTLKVRPPARRKNLKPAFEIPEVKKSYENGDTILFSFSDRIIAVDTSKIELLIYDTVRIPVELTFKDQYLSLKLNGLKGSNFKLNVLDKAIGFENFQESFSFTRTFDITDPSALGVLILSLNKLPENAVVEMLYENKPYKTFNISKTGTLLKLPNLSPGNYSFKAYIDENKDGRWTTGDFIILRQPEKVIRFTEGVKIRSNWEIEAELEPIADEQE
ncbi:MAG: Ig-like domain-containing protein [Flavobacteriia bacterium]|nr:Ig-like domain-containing protein [Flavobacteriia bacterium]OJX38605.1 MAG: hypothetical protein BGO87_10885 [Flavobacteriia bacterium 40-80]